MWRSLVTVAGAVLMFAGWGHDQTGFERMGREKLPMNINNFFEEFCRQVLKRKWSRWGERCCQRIFVFIFNERNRYVFICYVSSPGKWGEIDDAGERGRISGEIPLRHWEGWNLVQKWGLAWTESPGFLPKHRRKGREGTAGSDAGRWAHEVVEHVRDLSECFCFLGDVGSKWMMVSALVVEGWGEKRSREGVEENGRGTGQGHWVIAGQHRCPQDGTLIRSLEWDPPAWLCVLLQHV